MRGQPAFNQHQDPVGHASHGVHVVLGVEHCHAPGSELLDKVHQAGPLGFPQAGGRLVQQQQLRPGGQRHGQFQPFFGTVRQAQRILVSQRQQAGLLKQRARRLYRQPIEFFEGREGRFRPAGLHGELHVLPDRQGFENLGDLEGAGHTQAQAGRRLEGLQRLAAPFDLAAGQRVLPGNAGKAGRFSRAVRADQRHALARLNLKTYAIDRLDAAEMLDQLSDLEHQRLPLATRWRKP